MSNFISWAIGEVPQESKVEKVQVPSIPDPTPSVEKLDKPEVKSDSDTLVTLEMNNLKSTNDSVETIKVETKSEVDSIESIDTRMVGKSKSIPMEYIHKIEKYESQAKEMELIEKKSNDSDEATVLTKLTGISFDEYDKSNSNIRRLRVKSESSNGVEIENLHKEIVTELDGYFKSNSLVESLGSDYNKSLENIASALESSIHQEPLEIGSTYNDYFDNLTGFVESINGTEEFKSDLNKIISNLKIKTMESLRLEYMARNPDSNLTTDDIVKLEIKIADYPDPAISILKSYTSESNLEQLQSLSASFDLKSKPDDKDFFQKYAEYVKPLNGNMIELGVSAWLGVAALGGIDPKILDGVGHTVDTLTSRFGLNNLSRGINYKLAEFKSYADVAMQILQRSKAGIDGGYFPFSAENLIFAATFAAFLDPISNFIKIEDAGNRASLIAYSNIYRYFNDTNNPFFIKELKSTETRASKDFYVLPFKGRESVRDLELRNAFDWDAELEPLKLNVSSSFPPRFVTWNVDPSGDSIESEHRWIPIDKFSFNISEDKSSDMDLYGVMSIKLPGVKWNLTGSLSFIESSRLWFNRWRSEYIKYLYGDSKVGSYLRHPYYECCYLLTIYLFDALDHITNIQDKTRYLKKYRLIILPQLGSESYSDTKSDSKQLNFSVVGTLDGSLLKLGEVNENSQQYFTK